jgi:hypothetical protein
VISVWAWFGARGAEVRQTDDFREVAEAVRHFAAGYGPRKVLLVCDIDNTLLAMDEALGSEQWFEWQKYLVEHEPRSPYLVAEDFPGLLKVQGVLYNLGRMHPPQGDLPSLIDGSQDLDVHTLVLTSRGPEYRVATERELRAAGYDFSRTALPVNELPAGRYLPYELAELRSNGLTPLDAVMLKLGEPRPVSYEKGVYMTAGQSKGAMLLALLAHAEVDIDAVIYVDDNARHVAHVLAAVDGRGMDIDAFHYTRESATIQQFQFSDKTKVNERWRNLDRTLQEMFD